MADESIKFHLTRSLGVLEMGLNSDLTLMTPTAMTTPMTTP